MLLDLVKDLGAQLREKCAAGAITPEEAAQVRASQPSTADTARLYAEGIEKLHAFDNLGASQLLQQAVAAEPGNALAHLLCWPVRVGRTVDTTPKPKAKPKLHSTCRANSPAKKVC